MTNDHTCEMLQTVEHQHPLAPGERTDDMNTPSLPPASGFSDQPQGEVCPPVQTGGAASSGIYCIHNELTGKRYIGQAVVMSQRRREHFSLLRRGCHRNDHLQASFNKHRESSFVWTVLEYVPVAMLDIREMAWIEYHKTTLPAHGYNVRGGGGVLHALSDETKRKLSKANTGKKMSHDARRRMSEAKRGVALPARSAEHCRKLAEANKRRTWTDEARQKLSKAHKGKTLTEAHRAKMAESARRRHGKKEV